MCVHETESPFPFFIEDSDVIWLDFVDGHGMRGIRACARTYTRTHKHTRVCECVCVCVCVRARDFATSLQS